MNLSSAVKQKVVDCIFLLHLHNIFLFTVCKQSVVYLLRGPRPVSAVNFMKDIRVFNWLKCNIFRNLDQNVEKVQRAPFKKRILLGFTPEYVSANLFVMKLKFPKVDDSIECQSSIYSNFLWGVIKRKEMLLFWLWTGPQKYLLLLEEKLVTFTFSEPVFRCL